MQVMVQVRGYGKRDVAIELENRSDGWYIKPPEEVRDDDDLSYGEDGFSENPFAEVDVRAERVAQALREKYDIRY